MARELKAANIKNLVRSLTVVDTDVSSLRERLAKGKVISPPGIGESFCIIDITCCIIDCSKCLPPDIDIYSNPENQFEGFVFKLKEQADNPDAPVYFIPSMDARTAFRMGHQGVKVPGGAVQAKSLGLAGELLSKKALTKNRIATTASVISLAPTRSFKAQAAKTPR